MSHHNKDDGLYAFVGNITVVVVQDGLVLKAMIIKKFDIDVL